MGWRHRAAFLAGLTAELERPRYRSPEAGFPGRSRRLTLRARSGQNYIDDILAAALFAAGGLAALAALRAS